MVAAAGRLRSGGPEIHVPTGDIRITPRTDRGVQVLNPHSIARGDGDGSDVVQAGYPADRRQRIAAYPILAIRIPLRPKKGDPTATMFAA